jgi:hypothetical protein
VEAMPMDNDDCNQISVSGSDQDNNNYKSKVRTMKSTAPLALIVSSACAFCSTRKAGFGASHSVALSAQRNLFDNEVMKGIVTGVTAISFATGVVGPLPILPVQAAESRLIGEIQGSGLIFKVRNQLFFMDLQKEYVCFT